MAAGVGSAAFLGSVLVSSIFQRHKRNEIAPNIYKSNLILPISSKSPPPIDWLEDAVIYQISGIIEKLHYLQSLGVTALCLSPVQPSPNADFGYDQSNYCDIDPSFGTLDDFKTFIAKAHARSMKVLMDGVFNHTSDKHSWFIESRYMYILPPLLQHP